MLEIKKEWIEMLNDDENYYGEFGRQFLSNSDIGSLIKDPASFKSSEKTIAMLQGNYFHLQMLEPEKLDDFVILDVSSRNTKLYKEFAEDELFLLRKEADEMDILAKKMKSNMELYDMMYNDSNRFEVPMIKQFNDELWKSKADIVTDDFVIDLKTTGDISKFASSAWAFDYDSQAYIYQENYGKPMKFLVGCKKTHQLKLFDCSEEFISRGRDKLLNATVQYRKFYGPDATEDVNNYYSTETL